MNHQDIHTSPPPEIVLKNLGREKALEVLEKMLLIRHFETRGESAYQQGLIGGFFHSYAGQEAIQTAAIEAFGTHQWYCGFYRCHALALLLEATPKELMAELYGRATGNAKGRGGSMHLYTPRMLGGFAIVGGQMPIACGVAFALKYKKKKDELAICFIGEGAVAQGAFHEALNLASLWNLPVIFIIENNQWGMGTHVSRAICTEQIAKRQGPSYNISSYTLNGMDFFNCYGGFSAAKDEVLKSQRPVLIECLCQRFRGHSISDPGLYRTKEEVAQLLNQDPILYLKHTLMEAGLLDEETFKAMDKRQKECVVEAMQYAENSPWPSVITLEEDVYAP